LDILRLPIWLSGSQALDVRAIVSRHEGGSVEGLVRVADAPAHGDKRLEVGR
jgi:hypothetical protein